MPIATHLFIVNASVPPDIGVFRRIAEIAPSGG